MMLPVEMVVRSSLVLLSGLVVAAVLRRQSAATRHLVVAASLVVAALVAPLALFVPAWQLPSPWRMVQVAGRASAVTPPVAAATTAPADRMPSGESPASSTTLLVALWLTGSAGGAVLLLVRMARLARLSARARPIEDGPWRRLLDETGARLGIARRIRLVSTDDPGLIATWGAGVPRLVIPNAALAWTEARIASVVAHEAAHIRRHDWIVQLGAEVLRTLCWFNPLVWIACARLRRESEHACDDTVLALGIPAREYASHLVDIAVAGRGGRVRSPALAIAHRSTLEGRIAAMLNTTVNRQAPTRRTTLTIGILLLALAVPAASLRLSAQTGPGPLVGHVYDRSGAVLPEVTVTLIDEQQVRWPTMTDGSGRFEFSPVGAGRYVLEASLPGFRTLRDEFALSASKDWTRVLTLQVGELQETITVTAQRPAASRAPISNALRVGGNIKPPLKITDVRPVYPDSMREAGLEGHVPLEAFIAADGTVASVRVLSAQVHPDFARAAEDAVRRWAFTPTLLNGTAVEVRMEVSVQFSLRD